MRLLVRLRLLTFSRIFTCQSIQEHINQPVHSSVLIEWIPSITQLGPAFFLLTKILFIVYSCRYQNQYKVLKRDSLQLPRQ